MEKYEIKYKINKFRKYELLPCVDNVNVKIEPHPQIITIC